MNSLFTPLQKASSFDIPEQSLSKAALLALMRTNSPLLLRTDNDDLNNCEVCLNLCTEFHRIVPKSEENFQKMLEEMSTKDETMHQVYATFLIYKSEQEAIYKDLFDQKEMVERAFLSIKESKLDSFIECEQRNIELVQKLEISEGKLNLYKITLDELENEKESFKMQLMKAAEGLQFEFLKVEATKKSIETDINQRIDCKIEAFLKENGLKKQEMMDTIYEQDEKIRRFEEEIASLNRKLSLREDKISRQDDLVTRLSIDKKKQFNQDIQHIISEYEQKLSNLTSEHFSFRKDVFEEKLELQSLNTQLQAKIVQLEAELRRHQEEKRALKLELEEEGRRLEEKEGNFLVMNEEFRDKLKELEGRMSNEKKNLQFRLKKYEEEELAKFRNLSSVAPTPKLNFEGIKELDFDYQPENINFSLSSSPPSKDPRTPLSEFRIVSQNDRISLIFSSGNKRSKFNPNSKPKFQRSATQYRVEDEGEEERKREDERRREEEEEEERKRIENEERMREEKKKEEDKKRKEEERREEEESKRREEEEKREELERRLKEKEEVVEILMMKYKEINEELQKIKSIKEIEEGQKEMNYRLDELIQENQLLKEESKEIKKVAEGCENPQVVLSLQPISQVKEINLQNEIVQLNREIENLKARNQELQKETQFQSENISILKAKLEELLTLLTQQQNKNEQLSVEKQKIQSESLALSLKLNEIQSMNVRKTIAIPLMNNNIDKINNSCESKEEYKELWEKYIKVVTLLRSFGLKLLEMRKYEEVYMENGRLRNLLLKKKLAFIEETSDLRRSLKRAEHEIVEIKVRLAQTILDKDYYLIKYTDLLANIRRI